MHIKVFAILAVALSFARAQEPPEAYELLDSIRALASASSRVGKLVSHVDFVNAIGIAAQAVNDYVAIARDVSGAAADAAASGTGPFSKQDQLSICGELSSFATAHQQLLKGFINKFIYLSHGVVGPVTDPLGGLLRAVDKDVDKLALSLYSLVPTCSADAKKRINSLYTTFKQVEVLYPVVAGAQR